MSGRNGLLEIEEEIFFVPFIFNNFDNGRQGWKPSLLEFSFQILIFFEGDQFKYSENDFVSLSSKVEHINWDVGSECLSEPWFNRLVRRNKSNGCEETWLRFHFAIICISAAVQDLFF